MANHNAVGLLDVLTLPEYRGWRIVLGAGILFLALLGPPGCTYFRLATAGAGGAAELEALAGPIDYTTVEQTTTEQAVDGLLLHSCAFPIWQAPSSSTELFGLSTGLPERATLDSAMEMVAQLQAQTRECVVPENDSARTLVDRAIATLGDVSQEQGFDRGVVLYHRALLLTWTRDYGAALQELNKLDERIREAGVSLRGRSAKDLSGRGVTIAANYMRAYLMLKIAEQTNASRDPAIEQFRSVIAAAPELYVGGATRTGPFVALRPDLHVVAMSTAPVWNDLIKALSIGNGGVARALNESETLRQSASYLREDLALAANLMLLTAADSSDLSLTDRRDRVQTIARVFDRDPNAQTNVAARQRASIALAVLGLPVLEQARTQSTASAVRTAFVNIFEGAATGSEFPSIDVPNVRGFGGQLDMWLFIREWRRLLEAGNVAAFQSSYAELLTYRDIDMGMLNAWRNQAMAQVQARARGPGVPEGVRQQMCALSANQAGGNVLNAAGDMMRCTYGMWLVPYLLGWALLVILGLFALVLLGIYYRTFKPHHYIARLDHRRGSADRGSTAQH